jgi:hypothetical protein
MRSRWPSSPAASERHVRCPQTALSRCDPHPHLVEITPHRPPGGQREKRGGEEEEEEEEEGAGQSGREQEGAALQHPPATP